LLFIRGCGIKTNVYVDGFNLYYGAVKGTSYRWLDIAALCRRLLPAGVTINRIRYFTAETNGGPSDPHKIQRQRYYFRALMTLPGVTIHLGRFLESRTRMRSANPPPNTVEVIKTEEKGSDVNLASWLLLDGFKRDYDQAVVISNDSDLVEPIRMVRRELSLTVGILNPHTQATCDREFAARRHAPGAKPKTVRPSVQLKKAAKFQYDITSDGAASDVALCQFPNSLRDAKGSFSKPHGW
jgi:uncharacterized LabA/DUF88 family protein